MAVFSISAGAKGFEVSVGGINHGSEIDCANFRAPEQKSPFANQFGRGFDESAVQEAMTHFPQPQNNNTFKV